MKKVSIVVPTYNVEEYIDDFVRSLESMTVQLKDLEVIIVNDGSTDNSRAKLDRYMPDDECIKVVHLEKASGAAGYPRNVGIARATGTYITFMDPDDLYLADGIEKLLTAMERTGSDVVMGTFELFNSQKTWEHELFQYQLTHAKMNIRIEEYPLLLRAPNNMALKLYRTDFVRDSELSFPVGVAAQDAVFTAESFFQAEKITFIPEKIFKYRIRDNTSNLSVTQSRNLKYFQDFMYIRTILMDTYKKYNKVDYFHNTYTRDLNWLLHQIERSSHSDSMSRMLVLQTVLPFIQLSKSNDISAMAAQRKELAYLIAGEEFCDALQFIDHIMLNKKVNETA
ncbi:glycosyltransferase family 2 protein [Paenibacillus glycanilyticus]|uniref:Glycosyltransferase 2-like domain-containing protein n=1 Tax=Paenibacillus glycanilyticus TaxID=126569 RepID=A0ABQ6GHI5_9BACL|nr:glycosyltransferase family 2 protein [Paenibacillus glycanilyticus]GLX70389.1 hypothetical protein MU1_47350 [Paenibacillus glycanilyticus]